MTLELITKVIKYIEEVEEHFSGLYDNHKMPEIYFDLIKLQAVLEERERVKSGVETVDKPHTNINK